LTHHLKKALPLLLRPNKHGFTPHRQAKKAIFDLYVTNDKMLQQSPQSALLSVDFKKAFDSVAHQYLLALLQSTSLPNFETCSNILFSGHNRTLHQWQTLLSL